jgi:hypothetical protein
LKAELEFLLPGPGEDKVGVGVDEARQDHFAGGVQLFPCGSQSDMLDGLIGRPHPDDPPVRGSQGPVRDYPELSLGIGRPG